MRASIVPALIALVACAPRQPSGAIAPASTRTEIEVEGMRDPIVIHNQAGDVVGFTIGGSPARAWEVLPLVYRSNDLSITQVDAATRSVRGQRLRSRAPLLGHPLHEYLDCGTTAGVPNVGGRDIDIYLATQLRPGAGDSTIVQTAVTAFARPGATSGDRVQCDANQRMAAAIAAAVASALAQPGASRP